MSSGNEHGKLRAPGARGESPMRLMMRQLPREDRQLLALWEAGQVSPRNLAGVLGCHHATVYRRVRRMRTRLSSRVVGMLAMRGHELSLLHYTIAVRRHLWGQRIARIAAELWLSRREMSRATRVLGEWLAAQRYRKGDES